MTENTFLGLQPYTEADAYRFKGRTEESQELFRLIVRNDYTVCYAESGEGKTSLLNAGVFPLLRQNMYFPIAITFTSDDYERTPDNFDTIIDRCIKDSIDDYNEQNKGVSIEYKICSTDFQDTGCQPALQQELSKYSWWKMRNYKPQAMGLTFTPVFVFDQFEEVFNLPGSIVWTKKFFDWLEDVSSDSCPGEIVNKVREIIGANAAFPAIKEEKDFKAVFSLRKEFIGELDYWCMQKCFIPSLKDNRYCLKALTYEGAKKVMTQQQRFEETKVEQVLSYFVQQYSREPEKTLAEKLPAIPALLLSVVCDSWEKDIDFFSGKGENEIGQSLNKILERFYEEAISSITNELFKQEANSQPELIREEIETAIFALVDSNGKRVRRKSSELSHLDFDAKYKEILSNKRIIKTSKVDGEDYVEIVHDSLCPIIAKRKREREIKRIKEESERELQAQKERMRHRTRVLWMTVGCVVFFAISYWLICIGLKSRIPFDPNKIGYRETVPVFSRLYKVKDSTLVLRNCYVSPYTFIDNPEVRKLVLDGVLFYDNSFCFPNLDTIVIENGQYFVGYFNYNFIKDSVSVVIARRPMFNDTNSKVYRLNIVKHVGKVLIASEDSSYLKWYNGVLLVKNNKDVWESILYNDDVDYYTDTIEFGCNVPHPFWALLDYDIANPPHVEDSDSLIKKYNKRLRWHLVCSDTNDTSLCSSDVPASGGIEVDLPYIKKIAPNTFNFNNCVVYNAFFQRLEEVGDYAFYWQKNLHSIKMPNVRKIGASAFYRCYDLKLVILDSLRELMGQAFNYCDSLKTLYLPVVDTIGEFALPCHPPVYKWGWNLNSKNHVNFCNTFAKDGFPKNQMDSIKDSDSVRDVSSDKVLMDGYSFTRIGDWNNRCNGQKLGCF